MRKINVSFCCQLIDNSARFDAPSSEVVGVAGSFREGESDLQRGFTSELCRSATSTADKRTFQLPRHEHTHHRSNHLQNSIVRKKASVNSINLVVVQRGGAAEMSLSTSSCNGNLREKDYHWHGGLLKPFALDHCNLPTIDYLATLHHSLLTPHPELPPAGTSDSLSEATNYQSTVAAFTTAQPQSPWLQNSSHTRHPPLDTPSQASTAATVAAAAAAPATHTQHHFFRPQGDFVLYDSPTASETRQRPVSQPNLSVKFSGSLPFTQATTSSPYACADFSNQNRTRPPVPLFTNNSTGKLHQLSHQENGKMEDFRLFDNLSSAVSAAGMDVVDMPWSEGAPSSTSVNMSSTTTGTTRTISPKDLVLSAPASSAITNLTSPSLQESPFDICESYDTSPLFMGDDNVPIHPGSFPLFPEALSESSDALQRSVSFQSFEESSSNDSPSMLNLGSNHKTSADLSPHISGAPVRHSSVSGVKGRRRNKPLAPIVYDPKDKTAVKRARNTESARQSRQRRYEWEEKMKEQLADREAKIEELKEDGNHWKQIALSLGYCESI